MGSDWYALHLLAYDYYVGLVARGTRRGGSELVCPPIDRVNELPQR